MSGTSDPAGQRPLADAAAGTPPKSEGNNPAALPDTAASLRNPPESQLPSTGPVQMAQMVSRAEQSEMRIGMNTTAFGSVEVRTVVHANDVGVLIGSEKGDLRSLLANEIPGIANSLQQQNLRLNQVNFHQGFASSNPMSSGGGDSQPRSFPSREGTQPLLAAERNGMESGDAGETSSPAVGSGLSILA